MLANLETTIHISPEYMPDIAKDVQTGFLVSANRGIRKRKYTCLCPDAHIVCLRKGLKKIPHFAHVPCSRDNGVFVPSCRLGGESECHIKAKHKLVEWKGSYKFALRICEVCREKVMENCSDGVMQIEARSSDKRWRYDVLYTRRDNTKLALEVYHKHMTGDEKFSSSSTEGVQVAEFDAESILSLEPGGVLDNLRDTSWICSQECKELKELREIEAKHHAQQQEVARRRAQQQELEEARRRAQQQKLEEARRHAQQQEVEEIRRHAQQQGLEEIRRRAQQQELEEIRRRAQQQELEEIRRRAQEQQMWESRTENYRKRLDEWESNEKYWKKRRAIKLPFEK